MNAIVGMADLLTDPELKADHPSYARTIVASGKSLLAIINEILDLSRIEAGKFTLHAEAFVLRDLVEDTACLLAPLAEEKDLELSFTISPDLPETVFGDPVRVRQVLFNLVGNAIKFTLDGHVAITVTGQTGTDVTFEVRDTGIGISENDLAGVFRAFEQVEDTRTRSFEGTGLGLAVCQQLVTLMGGSVAVTSRQGQGSVFTARLPLPPAVGTRPARALHPLRRKDGEPPRILLVDPLASRRVGLSAILRAHGCEVVEAGDADAALAMLRARDPDRPDVLLVDDRAAEDGGSGLIATLDNEAGAVGPAILMAALGRTRDAGAPELRTLRKPVREAELVEAIREVVLRDPKVARLCAARPKDSLRASSIDGITVLVADDNATNRFLMKSYLEGSGALVRYASSGLEALEFFEAEPAQVVLMDISMPRMDGYEATRRLRALEAERGAARCVVAALTAHAGPDATEAARAAGMDAFLTKPSSKATCSASSRP